MVSNDATKSLTRTLAILLKLRSHDRLPMGKTKQIFRVAREQLIGALLHMVRRVSRDVIIVMQSHEHVCLDLLSTRKL